MDRHRRVLIAYPYLGASGGGNAVAAWALEALRDVCDLSLATLGKIDYEAVNRSFGTSLRAGDFRVHLAPARYRALLGSLPTPGALLECCVTMRWAQNLDRKRPYDVVMGLQNEADFGRRGVQYINYPWVYLPRPDIELRWYHRIPGALAAYRGLCRRMARASLEGLGRNLSLANSEFTAARIRKVHGCDSTVLYPPAPGDFPDVPWEQRRAGLIAVGRFHECKRYEMAVEIVDELRRRGHDISLTVAGQRDRRRYGARLEALAATRPWFRIVHNLSREDLAAEIAHHRYGIHCMFEEHFGIAPAEMQRAGCITFVHNSGGPVEIVGGDRRLTFDAVADAVEKIAAVVTDRSLECRLRQEAAARAGLFTVDRFCESIRALVAGFESNGR